MKKLITFLMVAIVAITMQGKAEGLSKDKRYASKSMNKAICDAPLNLTVTIHSDTTIYSWDAVTDAISYNFQIKYPGYSWANYEYADDVATNSITLIGVIASATFDWRVNATCSTGVSLYTESQYTQPCPEPTDLSVTNLTPTSAVLNWVPSHGLNTYISDFVVAYRILNSNAAWTSAGHTFNSTIAVTGLLPNTAYEWCVNQTCPYFNSNPVIGQFTTLALPCTVPTGLTATYLNNVTTFTWDAVPGATGYYFGIKLQSTNSWGSSNGTLVPGNSYSMTGLFQSATFNWRVATVCNSTITAFTQTNYTSPCPQPSNPVTTGVTATTATVSWTAAPGYNTNTSNFSVGYRLANTNNAWSSAGYTSATSITISGLISNTAYEFCVNQSCMYSNSAPIIGQFTTAFIACNVPVSITVSNATSSQATVSWATVSGGLSYSVQYKPVSSNNWSASINVSGNTRILTGLASATLYDVRVKANCSAGSSTYISTQFTTYSSTCAAWGVNSSEFIDLFTLGTINRTSVREVGGYINTGLSTNLLIGSSVNPGQFSAGFNPGIIFAENYAVYIDFNRNGSFSDAGERVVNPTYVSSGSTIFNFNIAIPNNVTAGATKMRVIICRNGTTISPCSFTGFKGEVEDYNVNLVTSLNRNAVTTGNDIVNAAEFTVSPNPSNGKFSIVIPDAIIATGYEISAASGMLVKKGNILKNRLFQLDLTDKPAGIYLLKIAERNGKMHLLKLIKN